MKHQNLLFLTIAFLIFSCSTSENKTESESTESNEWELVILDSIQVDHLGNISTGDFKNGVGLLYDYTSNTLIKFNSEGKVLASQSYPKDGPNSISFINLVKIDSDGKPLIGNYRGDFQILNEDLTFNRKIEMPFASQSFGGLMDGKSLEFWNDRIILHFPGRDEMSPYQENYFKESFLLEMLNPSTGESNPIVRTPEASKFNTDQIFERPDISFVTNEDELLLYFNNEPKIHRYDLLDSGRYVETIDLNPAKFIQAPELKDRTERYSYEKLVEGNIFGVFANNDHYLVHYSEGISEDVFGSYEFDFPKDFPKLTELNQSYFRMYENENGWSNEIQIPKKIDKVFAVEDPTQPFYALRNDEYIGEEQEYITFYKLQLKRK